MSKPIQALGPGYLGLMGLKNNGIMPGEQHDSVQPIVDIQPFYLQGAREGIDGTVAAVTAASSATTTAFGTPITVPEGKVWHILGGVLFLNIAAGQVLATSVRLMAASSLVSLDRVLTEAAVVGSPNAAAAAVVGAVAIGVPIPPVMLRAGDSLIALIEWAHGAGTASLALRATIAQFQE